jgi:hypothetical protein
MSNLENKLNASIQSPRRRTPAAGTTSTPAAGTEKTTTGNKPATSSKPAQKSTPETTPAVSDLNAGGGREINPQRIWPD